MHDTTTTTTTTAATTTAATTTKPTDTTMAHDTSFARYEYVVQAFSGIDRAFFQLSFFHHDTICLLLLTGTIGQTHDVYRQCGHTVLGQRGLPTGPCQR
jgi:hypothetical protein